MNLRPSRPPWVTLTGVDESVSPLELVFLAERFPFVEWGVLYSRAREGQPRYPRRDWILDLAQYRTRGINVALHLCGSVAALALEGYPPPAALAFPRVQINGYDGGQLAGGLHGSHGTHRPHLWNTWATYDVEFILQAREPGHLAMAAREAIAIQGSVLFDASGGRGIAPAEWPALPAGVRVGCAGGITPETALATLDRVTALGASWIDMESSLRTEDDRFDLRKALAVLEAVAPRWRGHR